jgi:ribosomal protein S18 acetylase RimI-like enzyme
MTTLVPMTDAQFQRYLQAMIPEYAQDKVLSGQWAQAEALELARKSLLDSLPQGLATPDHYLYAMESGAHRDVVGMIWIAALQRGDRRVAFVFDVMVEELYRRQGHASRAFAAIERKALELGLSGVALHVFGHNPQAQALYVKLGYNTTNVNMFKTLA